MNVELYRKVVDANKLVHNKMAATYNTSEPHFKAENVAYVEALLKKYIAETKATKLLDLGCGTGFIINIAKKYVTEIDGVDISDDMITQVDLNFPETTINLILGETGSVSLKTNYYDLVTGYSFLHHLYDIRPTLSNAYSALKEGGMIYFDLDPNFYYWESINNLSDTKVYGKILNREISMVSHIDIEVEKNFGVDKDLFNHAEFGKNIGGGFKEELITEILQLIGFKNIHIDYFWYVGQGAIINNENYSKEVGISKANEINNLLKNILPLSRNLFKYISITATK